MQKLNLEQKIFLEQVYIKYKSILFAYISRRTEYSPDAEDILSEVFLIACRKCDRLMCHPKPLAFLFATARHKAYEYQRNSYRYRPFDENDNMRSLAKTGAYFMDSTEYENTALETVKALLSENEYELFTERFLKCMSAGEIAKKYGISEVAVYTRISRLKSKIEPIKKFR